MNQWQKSTHSETFNCVEVRSEERSRRTVTWADRHRNGRITLFSDETLRPARDLTRSSFNSSI